MFSEIYKQILVVFFLGLSLSGSLFSSDFYKKEQSKKKVTSRVVKQEPQISNTKKFSNTSQINNMNGYYLGRREDIDPSLLRLVENSNSNRNFEDEEPKGLERNVSYERNGNVIIDYFRLNINHSKLLNFVMEIPLRNNTYINVYQNGIKIKGNREFIYEIRPILENNWKSIDNLIVELKSQNHLASYEEMSKKYLVSISYNDPEAKKFLVKQIIAGLINSDDCFNEKIDVKKMFNLDNLEQLSNEEIFATMVMARIWDISQEIANNLFDHIKMRAESSSDSFAQFNLGYFYKDGFTLKQKKDEEKAIEWLRKSAEQNLAIAQFYLFKTLIIGKKVYESEAFLWLDKAADNEFALAQLYLFSRIKKQSNFKNIDLIQRAAEKGLVEAQIYMGEICEEKKDYKEALFWYEKAKRGGTTRYKNYTKLKNKIMNGEI